MIRHTIQEYTLVSEMSNGDKGFIKEVNKLINEGWEPLGGVCVHSHGYLKQAMVKYK